MNKLWLSLALLISSSLVAEQLVIPLGNQGTNTDKPKLGQDEDQVQSLFGQPIKKYQAVGQPPISRWQYQGFVVYFESGTVIHAVLTHKATKQTQLKDVNRIKP